RRNILAKPRQEANAVRRNVVIFSSRSLKLVLPMKPRQGFFSLWVTDRDHQGRAASDLQVLPFLLRSLRSPSVDIA
ncbi:hypothetical protein BHE74_00050631, partial [Ensete ventricosum]